MTCESTDSLAAKAKRPDIIIADNPMSPVGVETEFSPANTVESDAASRLGKTFMATGGTIHTVVAVKLPAKYRNLAASAISDALETEDEIQYCVLTGASSSEYNRWPAAGYVRCSVSDLAYVVATAKVSPIAVANAAAILEEGAKVLAAMLSAAAKSNPTLGKQVSASLRQETSDQTYAMGATIIINAFVFQETIVGTHGELADVEGIYTLGAGKPTKNDVISEWDKILSINYWPIFGIAKSLISAGMSRGMLK